MKKQFLLVTLFFNLLGAIFFSSAQNKALQFDGGGNYVSIPHVNVSNQLTVEAWIKTTQTGTGTIISWKNVAGGGDGDALLFRISNGKLQFGEWIGTDWKEYNSIDNVNTGEWTHVAIVRDGLTTTGYINGQEIIGSGTLHDSPICSTDTLTFGAITANWAESFVGAIDEVKIWNVARSGQEIQDNYNTALNGSETGLQGYWQFNDHVDDSTPNGRNGVLNGPYYVLSDLFDATPPVINNISFSESTSKIPTIDVIANQIGTLYWAVLEDGATTPTQSEIINGSPSIIAKDSGSYNSPTFAQGFIFTDTTLIIGNDYKVYAVSEGNNALFSNVAESITFTYQGLSSLPLGWFNTDIGNTGLTGSTTFSSNTFTIKGSGSDIWGSNDAFQMAFKKVNSDIEIIASVNSQTNTDAWAKAGVIVRESLDNNSKHVFAAITPENNGGAFYRSNTGNDTSYYPASTLSTPCWFRLIKIDNLVQASYSTNGTDWIKIASSFDISIGDEYYVGLAVSAHNNSQLSTTVFENVIVREPALDLSIVDKGLYFAKTAYTPTSIPVYNDEKDNLPKPILEGTPGWVDMYYRAWELAFDHIRAPQAGSPFVSNWYDEAFDNSIYQWDIIFMTMFGRYADHIFPGIQSLDNFYCRQFESGIITRIINEATGACYGDENSPSNINPPLFSWAEVENYNITGDTSRFALVLPALEKYFEFVEAYRKGSDTPHELYWSNGQASGMDNTPRDEGRPGGHFATDHQGWVDMSSQMVIQCNNIATICDVLEQTDKADMYRQKAQDIGDKINAFLWNDTDGLYYDVDINGNQTNWKTAASFWPMLAGITTPSQNEKLVANLKNPNSFWRDFVFPTLAADEPNYNPQGGYWLGAVWAPTNYAIIKGLEKIGEDEFAKEASEKYLNGLYQVYLNTGTLWENYAPELINGDFLYGTSDNLNDPCRDDFVGWTGLGPISLLIENVLGFRLNGADKHIIYDLRRLDYHGIENLRMNDVTTSIVCQERTDSSATAYITVTTDNPYTLEIWRNGEIHTYEIASGTNNIVLGALGVSEENIFEYNVYVDQSTRMLNLDLNAYETSNIEIKLFDMKGVEIINISDSINNSGLYKKQVNVSNLSKGVYIIFMEVNSKLVTKKIII
ncbi:LamG-like jellyroll fold domain-containing protein [Flavivirga sp. 57AJ16]|uniref:MGH1-like glycoside hydrolase domain-containing protein n=1 Tax=Flavivirga sp. 57AJ16 TaxID=3025307 RepID=UPI00236674B1|nr:LamG-like jellyroll fold domain-containing protein [Flavivirga sp. 57AJ16]MDD7887733.1 trehalase family glycosidase [Flavivirga sp. 57AJ16]